MRLTAAILRNLNAYSEAIAPAYKAYSEAIAPALLAALRMGRSW